MTSVVTLGSHVLTSESTTSRWRVTGLDGWIGRTLRRGREERVGTDGARPTTGHAESLTFTIRGQAVFASAEAAALERRELVAVAVGSQVEMTVTDAYGFGARLVEVDAVNVSPVRDSMFTYSAVVTATDPLLYGPEAIASATLDDTAGGAGRVWVRVWPRDWGVAAGVTPGAATVPNVGTASYHPRLRIDGPVTNPVIRLAESGASLRYNGTVPAGTWLDVVCGDRVVLLRGLVSHRHLVSFEGDWLSIPPGGGTVSWSADSFGDGHSLTIFGTEGAWA